jgi:hypothetical protein
MYLNTASQYVTAQLVSSDGTVVTSGTTTVYVTKDAGSQDSGSGTVTHKGNGLWHYAAAQADTNAGHVSFTFVNSSAVTVSVHYDPVVLDDYVLAFLKRDWTGITGEASRSVLNALRGIRNKWSISGATRTVFKEDDSTSAWTSALTTSGSAEPVTAEDPA